MKKLLLAATAATTLSTACKKEEKSEPTKTTMDYLQTTVWRYAEFYENGASQDLDACTTDDTWQFETDGDMQFNEGATRCNPNDPQAYIAKWTKIDDNTINIDLQGNAMNMDVIFANDDRMELQQIDGSDTYRIVFYKK